MSMVQKYRNNEPISAVLKWRPDLFETFELFSAEMIAEVTKTNSYIIKRFYFQHIRNFNYSIVVCREIG